MNIINEIANTFSATNVHEEVNMLRNDAKARIGHERIAAAIIAKDIDSLKVLTQGEYTVIIPNEFEFIGQQRVPKTKQQAWSDIIWVITINMLVENEYINSHQLANMLLAWSSNKENCMIQLNEDIATAIAEAHVTELQLMGCIDAIPSTVVRFDEDQQPHNVNVFKATVGMMENIMFHRKELQEREPMRFQPLRFAPTPWVDNFTGIGNNANAQLIKGSNKRYVPKAVLKAVNKLQAVTYTVHPRMKQIAKMVANNTEFYRNLWSVPADEWKEHLAGWRALSGMDTDVDYYFPVTMDWRGRMYYRGGLLTPQGADFAKAAFVFSEYKELGRTGFAGLAIALANALGIKGSQLTKVQRVEEGVKSGALSAMMADFNEFCKTYPKVDHCQAYILACDVIGAHQWKCVHGSYDKYESNIPCHQDGTCNGLQHQAAITRDLTTATATNMTAATANDAPNDVYGLVVNACASAVLRSLGRDLGKGPVMTGSYGAGEGTIGKKMRETFKKVGRFNEWQPTMRDDMIQAMHKAAPALMQVTDATKEIAHSAMARGYNSIDWTTADGFEASQQYVINEANIIRGGSYNATVRRHDKVLDAGKMSRALSPNFVHSIDSTHMRATIRACQWSIAAIHDSVASHACHYMQTNVVLRQQMYFVHTSYDHLLDLAVNNGAEKPVFIGEYRVEEVLQATNIFG